MTERLRFCGVFFQQLPCIGCAEVGVSSPFLPIAPGSLTNYPIEFTLFLADSHFPLVYLQFRFVLPSMWCNLRLAFFETSLKKTQIDHVLILPSHFE